MLANLVALNLDKKISQYCIRTNLEYSRYADDITISGSYNLAIHKEIIIKIVNENGFEVNNHKVRMVSEGSRQKVTGLVVNDKVIIGRTKKKTLRTRHIINSAHLLLYVLIFTIKVANRNSNN